MHRICIFALRFEPRCISSIAFPASIGETMFVLILTTFLLGPSGATSSETATISGFTSLDACKKAATSANWNSGNVRHAVLCVSLDGK